MSDATPHKPLLWVESGGGPLVVVPESALASWCTDTEATSADEFSGWSDYGRACQIDDYIGTLHVGCAEALVLADSPDTTTFLPDRMLFIRWSGADSESDILAALEPALTLAEWQSPVQWSLPAGPVVLFDAAWSGTDLPDHQPDNHLPIDLPAGVYAAEYAYVEPNPRTSFSLVRITPHGR
ncbi:Imm21 family immunity protein [Streptomyces sp. NPDC001773]|uniref:Imm21 family immunity protein n=1 Tax=Streptomyces sp. NPDC005499 TaxID=3154883 RepID=UPI0033A47948